ncbi:MAG: adenosine kinase [Deltaproteobacteria bacterium]|nr:adenosine kinase [Deltaproteobacteria bacterium]
MKNLDVVGICNALVDILIHVDDADLVELGLRKGVMHLVDGPRQAEVLHHFKDRPHAVELGGSAMNAIRTLAQLEKRTAFAGMVGPDSFGEKISARMHQLGIKAHLGKSGEPTGSCVILITPDGERTMNTHLGASRLYGHAEVPHKEIEHARVLHFCGYQWDTDDQKTAITQAIATAKTHDTLVSFDVADPFAVERSRDAFVSVIKDHADIVFANREEAKLLYGTSAEDAAERIAATGAIAVVKLGADGALVQKGREQHRIHPVPTQVVDTTAAGDMFAAGFLYGFTSGKSLDVAGRIAATLASDVISRVGATVSDVALGTAAKI